VKTKFLIAQTLETTFLRSTFSGLDDNQFVCEIKYMRLLLYAGKGGVGKTSVAAATGLTIARSGLKTLVLSLDPAHSLSDAFDLDKSLMDKNRGQPIKVYDELWIQELDIYEEIEKNWGEVHKYISVLLNTSGIEDILAEELAILPGMEEISALLYINRYARQKKYDVVILDCAPTAESIRFVSLPKALEWYMKKVFSLERRIARMMRPVARRMSDIPLPEDEYFESIERLFDRLRGVDQILNDPKMTTVRLVTNAEKMVLRETQRAFMFFSLHQLSIDAIILNRIFEDDPENRFLNKWHKSQKDYMELVNSYFHPIPILTAPFYQTEVCGIDKLLELGEHIYQGRDPCKIFYEHRPYEFACENHKHIIRLHLPFVEKEDVELAKIGEELIIRIGNFKRNIILPRTLVGLEPRRAKLEKEYLTVEFGGNHE